MSTFTFQAAARASEHSGPISQWIALGGHRFHYVETGIGAAPALLYLHGYTDSWRSVEPLLPALRHHFQVYALDQRGHGQSDADFERYFIDDFAADAAEFIRTVIRRPVVLVGHSLGSLVAQRLGAAHRDLVSKLVLIGSTDKAGGNPAIAELNQALAEAGDRIDYDFARSFQESTLAKPIAPEQFEIFVRESLRLKPEVWRKVADGLLGDDKVVADSVDAPTPLIWGERDGVFDADAQHRLESLLKLGRLVFYPDVGHAPNWEVPELVAATIIDFAAQ